MADTTISYYCDKQHVNQLTALMMAHGVSHVVACPGSRNAVLVHNFTQNSAFTVYSVIDERSAGFVALGMSIAKNETVAVCVTSGSALLNLLPAVCEAYYRQARILIISADRPAEDIEQMDGQTIQQINALQPYAPTFQMADVATDVHATWNNRIINEALNTLKNGMNGPVHINMPISEPLFSFTTRNLPAERVFMESTKYSPEQVGMQQACEILSNARFPMLVVGQMKETETVALRHRKNLFDDVLVYAEAISNFPTDFHPHVIERCLLNNPQYQPDVVIHIGGNQINKSIKQILRATPQLKVIRIETGKTTPDTFRHLTVLLRSSDAMQTLVQLLSAVAPSPDLKRLKEKLFHRQTVLPPLSSDNFSDINALATVLSCVHPHSNTAIHLANSSVVRNANHYLWNTEFPIYCNRGVNGIEGSMSAAVGHALACPHQLVLLLIGDLSFFYDNNALWNERLQGNLRIVLFNNGGGQIFHRLPGLNKSTALSPYISGSNYASAEGLCRTYHVEYHAASTFMELNEVMSTFLQKEAKRPVLLEIFTDPTQNKIDSDKIEQCYR